MKSVYPLLTRSHALISRFVLELGSRDTGLLLIKQFRVYLIFLHEIFSFFWHHAIVVTIRLGDTYETFTVSGHT